MKTSSEQPHQPPRQPELFLDRGLGRRTAAALREAGLAVHLVADVYPDDADNIPDEEWIAEGCRRGWVMLTKDQRIRYRKEELGALEAGHVFCLASGNLAMSVAVGAFLAAMPRITQAVAENDLGFWKVYADGEIRKTWP